jgi:hypothetical protein
VQGAAKKQNQGVRVEDLQPGEQGSRNYCMDDCMRLALLWETSLVQSVNSGGHRFRDDSCDAD